MGRMRGDALRCVGVRKRLKLGFDHRTAVPIQVVERFLCLFAVVANGRPFGNPERFIVRRGGGGRGWGLLGHRAGSIERFPQRQQRNDLDLGDVGLVAAIA